MKRLASLVTTVFTAGALALIPVQVEFADGAVVSMSEAACDDGSCKPKNGWICNIGGGDWTDKCDVANCRG